MGKTAINSDENCDSSARRALFLGDGNAWAGRRVDMSSAFQHVAIYLHYSISNSAIVPRGLGQLVKSRRSIKTVRGRSAAPSGAVAGFRVLRFSCWRLKRFPLYTSLT